MDRYDQPRMGSEHPIDQEVRSRLRALFESGAITESEFARRAGLRQPWLHRYVRGEGHANIDEVIRLAAVYAGVQAMQLTPDENELLRLWRGLRTVDDREDVVAYLRLRARRQQPKESTEPAPRTLPQTARKARGKL